MSQQLQLQLVSTTHASTSSVSHNVSINDAPNNPVPHHFATSSASELPGSSSSMREETPSHDFLDISMSDHWQDVAADDEGAYISPFTDSDASTPGFMTWQSFSPECDPYSVVFPAGRVWEDYLDRTWTSVGWCRGEMGALWRLGDVSPKVPTYIHAESSDHHVAQTAEFGYIRVYSHQPEVTGESNERGGNLVRDQDQSFCEAGPILLDVTSTSVHAEGHRPEGHEGIGGPFYDGSNPVGGHNQSSSSSSSSSCSCSYSGPIVPDIASTSILVDIQPSRPSSPNEAAASVPKPGPISIYGAPYRPLPRRFPVRDQDSVQPQVDQGSIQSQVADAGGIPMSRCRRLLQRFSTKAEKKLAKFSRFIKSMRPGTRS
ncbi:hypothetical protein M405DRAFT_809596 [Rhizopogon salebrosus TDB-379]|nr:hypothetical protein M405DRAFT_809596 [Rhizopogon salebrosus TDB-379]